jgi:hypothetical protein
VFLLQVCARAEAFYQENERDVPDQIVNAYQHNYSNVLDFVHLQVRRNHPDKTIS